MEDNYIAIRELLRENERAVERERERVEAMSEQNKAMELMLENAEKQERVIEDLRDELEGYKEECKALKMQLEELNKMTSKVVEKTEHEDLAKVLRTYLNKSKRKQAKKRGYIKMVILEMAQYANLELPQDMADTLETFDDEDEKTLVKVESGGMNVQYANKIEL